MKKTTHPRCFDPARRRLLAVPLLALFAGCETPEPAAERGDIFAAIVAEARDAAGSPGLSAAVALDGELIWSGASGLADIENGVPATAVSVYRIASISKPVAAAAVMQLVAQGALDLDAPIQEYFPAFPEKEHPVTVRHLLTHTSGIRHYNPGEMDMKDHFDTVEAGIDIFKDDPLLFEPGTEYSYSTYAYNMLAGAVESVSGLSFDDYLRQNIWGPAGMDATYLEHQGGHRSEPGPPVCEVGRLPDGAERAVRRSLDQMGGRRHDRHRSRPGPLRPRARRRNHPLRLRPRPDDDAVCPRRRERERIRPRLADLGG